MFLCGYVYVFFKFDLLFFVVFFQIRELLNSEFDDGLLDDNVLFFLYDFRSFGYSRDILFFEDFNEY